MSSIFLTSFTPSSSSPLNGSSRTNNFGFSIIACAIPRRCFIPRLYLLTGSLLSGSRFTNSIIFFTCSFDTHFLYPAKISRFLNPDICEIKDGFSIITPIFSGKSMSFPITLLFTLTVPCVGCTNPQMHFINIVFPDPLRPTRPYIFPHSNCTFISCKISLPRIVSPTSVISIIY